MSELFFTLGDAAIGTIQPRKQQQERLDEFTHRLAAGEFHIPVADTIPARCVDGRSPLPDTPFLPAPNTAGGSESLFVADDLTVRKFVKVGDTVLLGYKNTLNAIKAAGYEVGGHSDTHANGEKSGCGANDRLSEIYHYIASRADILREVAAKLGVEMTDETHDLIMRNAGVRTSFSKGAELLACLRDMAKSEFIDTLDGDHNEVAVVINARPHTTLDRAAVKGKFGDLYQAFNVDIWAFYRAVEIGTQNANEAAQKFAAMVYYNLATAMVLAGPNLRVVVLA